MQHGRVCSGRPSVLRVPLCCDPLFYLCSSVMSVTSAGNTSHGMFLYFSGSGTATLFKFFLSIALSEGRGVTTSATLSRQTVFFRASPACGNNRFTITCTSHPMEVAPVFIKPLKIFFKY